MIINIFQWIAVQVFAFAAGKLMTKINLRWFPLLLEWFSISPIYLFTLHLSLAASPLQPHLHLLYLLSTSLLPSLQQKRALNWPKK